jgi:sugar O-acyltransferase (sialic acid O-acetyltransferase NeuD family)
MPDTSRSAPDASGLLLFGAGGHGRVVADAARCAGWQTVVATDGDPARCAGSLLDGVPLIADASAWAGAVHVSIGNNAARARVAGQWPAARLATVVHPQAVVSSAATLGVGCFVAAGAIAAPGARAGRGVILNHAAVVDHDVQVGDWSHVAPGVKIGGGAIIGERVLLGAGCVVLPGVRVASGCVIGAGAVVHRPIEEAGVYVGVPARRIA